jgi:hypothetical protein
MRSLGQRELWNSARAGTDIWMIFLRGEDEGSGRKVRLDIISGSRQVYVVILSFTIIALIHFNTAEYFIPSVFLTCHRFII